MIEITSEFPPYLTILPSKMLLNTMHDQNSSMEKEKTAQPRTDTDLSCFSEQKTSIKRDNGHCPANKQPSQKVQTPTVRHGKTFSEDVSSYRSPETVRETTRSTDVGKVTEETACSTACNQETGMQGNTLFEHEMIDLAENWPVYSYTVRTMGPMCSQYLKFAKKTQTSFQDKNALRKIHSLANTAKFTDRKNKVAFLTICTELADARYDIVKRIKGEIDDQTEVPRNLFCPTLIMACQEDTTCLNQFLDSLNRLQRPVVVVLLKDDDEELDFSKKKLPNTIWTFAAGTDEIFANVDKLLIERLVFQPVLHMTKNLNKFVQSLELVDKRPVTKDLRNTAWQLLHQIQALYHRSDIPEDERPKFSPKINPDLTQEFVSEILSIPNVMGCGEVFGVLEIAINKEIKHDESRIAENVRLLCEKNSLHEFYIRFTSNKIIHYTYCGAEIGSGSTGTLGAFAEAKEIDNSKEQFVPYYPGDKVCIKKTKLLALISNHLAINQPQNKLYYDGNHIADIFDPFVMNGADIAAAEVLDQYRKSCRQVFTTQDGVEASCLLLENLSDLQTGEIVHIWGAKSKPGLGKIISSKYYFGNCVDVDTSGHFIIITDKSNEQRFAQSGDSGSIICVTSKDGTTVFAIGMLMGAFVNFKCNDETKFSSKIRKTRYCALELQYGISRLKEAYRLEIEWLSTR